jgi:hypothetical protein
VAECFCGCGRKVKFGKRAANKAGQQAERGLGVLDALAAPHFAGAREDEQAEPLMDRLDGQIAAGREYRERFRAMVHEEEPVSGLPGFTEWYRDVDGMRAFLSLSPEQQQRIIDLG